MSEDRWIPVSDRLPERYSLVLAFVPGGDDGANLDSPRNNPRHEMFVGCVERFDGKTAAVSFYDGYCGRARGVTHWRPLPAPPEVSE